MNKIKIVTFQNAYNYGAILQCIGLYNFLKKNKYKVEILNYDNLNISNDYKVFKKVRGNHPVLRFIKYSYRGIVNYKNLTLRKNAFENFLNDNSNLTQKMTKEEIIQERFANQIFIVGSDQVWNSRITHGIDQIYTLDFSDNIKKISYAASIGRDNLSENDIIKLCNKLGKFNHISVRENTAKELLSGYLKNNIDVVLDPSFLLSEQEWLNVANQNERIINEPYIFVYMSLGECSKIENYLQRLTNFKIIYIDEKNIFYRNSENVSWATPFDFINLIKYSEYVITTSFHASVFSIIFKKKFWVVLPKFVGSRITDLLEEFKLGNRIVNSVDMFSRKNYEEDINYEEVFKLVNIKIKKSKEWLKNAIEK